MRKLSGGFVFWFHFFFPILGGGGIQFTYVERGGVSFFILFFVVTQSWSASPAYERSHEDMFLWSWTTIK